MHKRVIDFPTFPSVLIAAATSHIIILFEFRKVEYIFKQFKLLGIKFSNHLSQKFIKC